MAILLVVDDDPPTRALLTGFLAKRGHRVLAAADGIQALEIAKETRPDLVISDGLMPRMDGFSLCHRWMTDEDLAQVPFFFYSGSYPKARDRRFGLEIGATAYFTKTTPVDVLASAVEAELAASSRVGSPPDVSDGEFVSGHAELVGRKLDAKVQELESLNRAYRQQGEDYRRLFKANPQAMWIYDSETLRFLTVNDAAKAAYGFSEQEWLQMTVLDILPQEEREKVKQGISDHVTTLADAEIWTHLKKDGSKIKVEISSNPIEFDGCNARLVMALDVTERLRAEMLEQAHLRRIEEGLQAVVDVVNRLVELRDPYTAGHQRRTAALCCAIGRELGLNEERLESLNVAALMHDVGKVRVPMDILNNPGPLSALQRKLLEEHPEAGYQLLKAVPFAAPVAEIVRQHHERLDGSGYPRGLSGDEILPEARILMVADKVEAMASHRPYRPACPIETALTELESGSGTLFDASVVAACLKLFREQGYRLPE